MIMREESMSTAVIENNPKVTIILLNYNGWEDAIECLESVYKITYPNWEVILVDNGSADGSVSKIKEWAAGKIPVESKFFEYDAKGKPIEYIEELFYDEEAAGVTVSKKEKEWDTLLPHQKLSILRIEKNRGFTGGNNIGIDYILKGRKTDYILLLSNDTVVDKEFLGELVKVGESDERIGITCPKIYFYNDENKIWFAGGLFDFKKGGCHLIGINELDMGQYNEIKETDYAAGTAHLIKKSAISKIGLLDSDYFTYYEDVDWDIRAKNAGFKVVYVPKARIWHKISATIGINSPSSLYYGTRNKLLFMKQHASFKNVIFFIPYFAICFLYTLFTLLIKKRKREAFAAVLYGFYDFVMGNYGCQRRY